MIILHRQNLCFSDVALLRSLDRIRIDGMVVVSVFLDMGGTRRGIAI